MSYQHGTRTREKDRLEAFLRLGDTVISTKKMRKDYGRITYARLFYKLLYESYEPLNKRWIRRFLSAWSVNWGLRTEELEVIRNYYQKHKDYYAQKLGIHHDDLCYHNL